MDDEARYRLFLQAGWEVRYLPCDDLPPWLWRSPRGISGSDYRCDPSNNIPQAVINDAIEHRDYPVVRLQIA